MALILHYCRFLQVVISAKWQKFLKLSLTEITHSCSSQWLSTTHRTNISNHVRPSLSLKLLNNYLDFQVVLDKNKDKMAPVDWCPSMRLSTWSDMVANIGKFFTMSTEFNKNISDWNYDYTDHKNGIDFFMRIVKWPKIDVKKCQNLIFKVNFQHQKSFKSF